MTTNQKVISWRWHQRQANPSEWRQSVDVLPHVVPGEVPGGPRHILHASALRLCVLITRTERSSGPNALNHTPPPTEISWATKQVDAEILGEAEQLVVESAGLLLNASSYSNWYSDIWYCCDTSPASESPPMSARLYTEWMIPPKCILEFCTNTFSELSKQCRPLSRCIVYAFFSILWLGWASKQESSEERDKQRRERERERERKRLLLQKTSALWTAQAHFAFRQHFPLLRAERIAKGTT